MSDDVKELRNSSCRFLSLVCRGGGEGGVFRRGDINPYNQIIKDFVNT